jgi:predicted protein tyrosine phosphatase
MTRVLFVCSRNRLRSPTAEQVFAHDANLEVASAGLNHDADSPMTADLAEWADIVFVMEKAHRVRLARRFGDHLKGARVVCLDIPDVYGFMEAELVAVLKARVPQHLRRITAPRPGRRQAQAR